MKNLMQYAIVKKDLQAILSNKRLLSVILIVPFMMAVFVPTIFILTLYFAPPDRTTDFQVMIEMLSPAELEGDTVSTIISLLMNNVMPVFFIIIPVMASSVMAASSFVGEKEKKTLETLLYCPLTLKELFRAKILSSFLMSMIVSFSAFLLMLIVTQTEILLTTGNLLLPNANWLIVMLLLSPAISVIAISLIVRGSAKAQSMEESQQRSVFLVLPVVLLIMGQFSGLLLINVWVLLGLSVLVGAIALVLMNTCFRKLSYEMLLH